MSKVPQSSLADGALTWLEANLPAFDPFRGSLEPSSLSEQRFAELALVCLSIGRDRTRRRDPRIDGFLDFIAPIFTAPLFSARAARRTGSLVPYIAVLASLRACGRLDVRSEDEAIQRWVDAGSMQTAVLPTQDTLALRYFLDICGFAHELPSYSTLARRSILARPINPILLSRYDVYVVTHVLFFLSDLGSRAVPLGRSQLANSRWAVELLLGMSIHAGDWDLVGELLFAASCIGVTESRLCRSGWEWLDLAQRPDGSVPGPRYDVHEAERLDRDQRRVYEFQRCAHTTLVAALAASACSARGRASRR